MEHRRPEALTSVGDIAESEAVEHQRPQQNHQCRGEGNATKGAAYPPDPELIEGLAAVQPAAQARSLHNEALQEGGDGHQPQASRENHQRQNHLAESSEIGADVDDRQTGHRDRGCGREQRLPDPHRTAGAQRCGQQNRADHDHQQTGHHRELGNGEPSLPTLTALQRLAKGHGIRGGCRRTHC